MPFISLIRTVLIILLTGLGLLNLFWMAQRRGAPAEFRGCLLAGLAQLLLATALLALAYRQNLPALGAALLGAACGLAWFLHIYLQSLHNTTM